jgi:hypothetical protein
MTNEQQEKIIELRKLGIGYRSIATAMNMSRDKVRNFCKAQGLDGYGKNNKKADEEKSIRELCKNCGKRINQKPIKGRPKTYCSKECKKEWEVKHPILYQHECYYCGKKFESKVKSADFCCHKCYIRDRFWRDEDIETVIKHLRKGTPLPKAPGWVKDLIDGGECRKSGGKLEESI